MDLDRDLDPSIRGHLAEMPQLLGSSNEILLRGGAAPTLRDLLALPLVPWPAGMRRRRDHSRVDDARPGPRSVLNGALESAPRTRASLRMGQRAAAAHCHHG